MKMKKRGQSEAKCLNFKLTESPNRRYRMIESFFAMLLTLILAGSVLTRALAVPSEQPDHEQQSPAQLFASLSARYPHVASAPATVPQQVRLAPGPLPGASMRASWSTMTAVNASADGAPRVTWWPASAGPASNATASAPASASTYSAGEGGWSGALYSAVMSPLEIGTVYAYTVGTLADVSDARTFSLPPRAGAPARLAFAADMGTIVPLGWAVADRLVEDHLAGAAGRYDAIVLGGDLSYSTVSPGSCSAANPGCDSLEFVWDFFGVQIEPFTSTTSNFCCVGNHEHVPGNITRGSVTVQSEFAAYEARFPMPSDTPTGGESSYWYSSDVGAVHLVFLSSEHASGPGSAQATWAAADLAAVDRVRWDGIVHWDGSVHWGGCD